MFAYVGSRTTKERSARGEGISIYRVDEETGTLSLQEVQGDLVNPSFLAVNRASTRLYAVHGDMDYITAFEILANGNIRKINQQSTQGKNPVHLALDSSEQFVLVSNHISASLAVLPLGKNGELLGVSQLLQITGTPGPHRKEQPHAKPHFNPFDPSGKYVLVPDKGLDKTLVFRFEKGTLSPCAKPEARAREGSGPRHLGFHPNGRLAYVINELDSTVSTCTFDATDGSLQPVQILSSISERYIGNSRASEIECSRNGFFLYASNRGEDTIAVFRIDQATGLIVLIQSEPCGGHTPRFFTLSPNGRWLYVLNEDSDTIVVFKVDPATGTLTNTSISYPCGSPVCMVFSR